MCGMCCTTYTTESIARLSQNIRYLSYLVIYGNCHLSVSLSIRNLSFELTYEKCILSVNKPTLFVISFDLRKLSQIRHKYVRYLIQVYIS